MNKKFQIIGGVIAIFSVVLIAGGFLININRPTPVTKTETAQSQTYPVTLSIEHPTLPKTISIDAQIGETAMDVMERVSLQYRIQLGVKEYSFGKMIESIDGLSSDQKNQKYWTLYINGQLSNIGASDYKVKNGDTITWKYGG